MSADLYPRIRAAIEGRLELARAATPGPWRLKRYYDADREWAEVEPDITDTESGALPPSTEDAAFIAANHPAWAIRALEADLSRLDRHAPVEQWAGWDHIPAGQPGGRQVVAVDCAACWIDNDPEGKEYDCHHVPEEWPCREIKLLARVYLEGAE